MAGTELAAGAVLEGSPLPCPAPVPAAAAEESGATAVGTAWLMPSSGSRLAACSWSTSAVPLR